MMVTEKFGRAVLGILLTETVDDGHRRNNYFILTKKEATQYLGTYLLLMYFFVLNYFVGT